MVGCAFDTCLGWPSDFKAQRLDPRCLCATPKQRTRPYVLARKGLMYPGKITSPSLKGQGGDCEEGKGECYPSYTEPPTTPSGLSAKEHMNTLCRTGSLVRLKLNAHSGRRRRTQRKDICSSVWQTTCGREFSFLRPQASKNIGAGNNRSWKSFENLNFTWAASQKPHSDRGPGQLKH